MVEPADLSEWVSICGIPEASFRYLDDATVWHPDKSVHQ
jgi:hypothetical protein